MRKNPAGGWLVALIAFAVVGSTASYLAGEQFGGPGWVSALIFLTILIGFVAISSFSSTKNQPHDDEDE